MTAEEEKIYEVALLILGTGSKDPDAVALATLVADYLEKKRVPEKA